MNDPMFPARLSQTLSNNEEAKVIAEVAIGNDLVLVLGEYPACPGGNDAGEKFNDAALTYALFDSDFNYLGALARFPLGEDNLGQACVTTATMNVALAALPVVTGLAREAYPGHAKLAGS